MNRGKMHSTYIYYIYEDDNDRLFADWSLENIFISCGAFSSTQIFPNMFVPIPIFDESFETDRLRMVPRAVCKHLWSDVNAALNREHITKQK